MNLKILNKRIGLICCFILISIGAFKLGNEKKVNVVSTMSVPVTNKVIVLDAGHGGEDRWSRK